GQVGDVIGDLGVNIGAMQCAPDSDGKAMIILSIDRELSETDLAKFTDVEGILKAKFVKIYNS
ncbi:MAG: hypothetical protein RR992_07490, partial [Clostridiales bacterium]